MQISNITNIGIEHASCEAEKAQTIWLNKLAIFTFFIISFYMSTHYFMGNSWVAIAFDGVYIITALLILYFQHKGLFQYAYYTVGIGYTLAFTCTSALLGSQNQIEYLIFVSTLGTILLFEEKRTRRLFFIFGFLTFTALKVFYIYFPKGLLVTDFPPIFNVINGLNVFGVIYVIVDKAMTDSRMALSKLSKKHEEVTLLNTTLEQRVKERTKEIEEKSIELSKSHEELKSFSYIAAHDMREPLRNIIGFSKLLNRDILNKKYDKIEEYSGYIDWATRRIDVITRDVVDYTNLEGLFDEVEAVDLNEVVSEVLRSVFVKRSDIIFEMDELPTIQMNPILAETLFKHLITNAIEYCDKPQPVIIIQHEEDTNNHLFRIIDNGVGISEEFYSKIFHMFKRLHNDYQRQGSGIGLSISRKIVEGYGGKISVESEVGKGSTFTFTVSKR